MAISATAQRRGCRRSGGCVRCAWHVAAHLDMAYGACTSRTGKAVGATVGVRRAEPAGDKRSFGGSAPCGGLQIERHQLDTARSARRDVCGACIPRGDHTVSRCLTPQTKARSASPSTHRMPLGDGLQAERSQIGSMATGCSAHHERTIASTALRSPSVCVEFEESYGTCWASSA